MPDEHWLGRGTGWFPGEPATALVHHHLLLVAGDLFGVGIALGRLQGPANVAAPPQDVDGGIGVQLVEIGAGRNRHGLPMAFAETEPGPDPAGGVGQGDGDVVRIALRRVCR
ncbi:MAG: hypothetical protein M3144_07805, partial [Actinomycetota bacterium]|nr:hypothetical protein [Actinomycetota bacterium]